MNLTSVIRNILHQFVEKNEYIETDLRKGFWEKVLGCVEHIERLTHSIKNARLKQRGYVMALGATSISILSSNVTFCVIKWFQRKSHFKRKNIINKNKKLKRKHVCFPFHHGTCTQRVFKFCLRKISPRKQAPTSRFYSSQHVENEREEN